MFDAFYAAGTNYIDSRDGAEAHVKALEVEAAGGERLIIASRTFFASPRHAGRPS